MSFARWMRRLGPPLLPATLILATAAGPALAGYQGTIDSNVTAFTRSCLGFDDPYPSKMLTAAVAAYGGLGYTASGYSGTSFTRSHVLARTVNDWGYYVHSHGDMYWSSTWNGSYSGFREDAGKCSGVPVVSMDIASRRGGRQSNLIVISTCHNGESNTTLPSAFAIEKVKAGAYQWSGPEFYLGYIGDAWDSDEWIFEQRFWSALASAKGVGPGFDYARQGAFGHPFSANWYGSYYWSGRAGPGSPCPNCA